jgi:hypothetical protein
MHVFTHLNKESDGKTGPGIYADGMSEHDGHVGQVLDKLKQLGLDENTIVTNSTSYTALHQHCLYTNSSSCSLTRFMY